MTARRGAHRKPRFRSFLASLRAVPGPRRMMRATWLRDDDLSPDDQGVALWAEGLKVEDDDPEPPIEGKLHGPQAPARRPQLASQLLTLTRVRAATIYRALPLDAVPHLRRGQYKDADGSFAAIAAAPPVLRADESFSITRADMAAGLARHAEDWTP